MYRGRDKIDRIVGVIRGAHSDFRYQPLTDPEELSNAGRVKWVEGRHGEALAVAGTDFILARVGGFPLFISFLTSSPEVGVCRVSEIFMNASSQKTYPSHCSKLRI